MGLGDRLAHEAAFPSCYRRPVSQWGQEVQVETSFYEGPTAQAAFEFVVIQAADLDRPHFNLLWPSGRQVTPKLRAFIDYFAVYMPLTR